MNKKILFAQLGISFGIFGAVYGQTAFTATNTGTWTDGATWNQSGSLPSAVDTIAIARGVTVTLNSAVTIGNITDSGTGSGTGFANLIISGSGASLTTTAKSRLYYDSRLNIEVLNGATLILGRLDWGSGDGQSNITVTDSYLSADFYEQFQGSKAGSTILLNGTSVGTATGAWRMMSGSADHKMTVHIDGRAQLNMGAHELLVGTTGNGAVGAVKVTGGGTLTLTNNLTINNAANASNTIQLYGAGSKINTRNLRIGTATAKALNSTSSLTFGGYDAGNNFIAADMKAMYADYEVYVNQSGSLNFILGDSNAAADTTGDVIFEGKYFKQIMGELIVDLTNINGLTEGTYYFGLISSTQNFWTYGGADAAYKFEDHITAIDGDFATYKGVVMNGNKLFIEVEVATGSEVPEPSAYAAIFGAVAIAFAACRRKK